MAVTISMYNHTRKLLANGEVDLGTLKLMLRDSSGTFTATHTVPANLGGSEVSGGGWTAGGEDIANAAVTTVNTNEAMLDGDDISVTATGASIGPASYAVITGEVSATPTLLFHIDLDGAKEAGEGTPFNVTWHANGIHRWIVPA